MRTFDQFQSDKQVFKLRNEILNLASKLSVNQLNEMNEEIFDFLEGPFQSSNMMQNIGNNLKSAWNAYSTQRNVGKTDNPVANGYTQLAGSLDQFIKAVQSHPVGKNQSQLLNMLGKFKSNLSAQGTDLASQMKQYNAQNQINQINTQNGQPLNAPASGGTPSNQGGTPLNQANAGQPAGGLNPDDVINHLKQQGFNAAQIAAYKNQIAKNAQQQNSYSNSV